MLTNQNQTLEHRTQRQAISLPGIFRVFCSTLYHFQRGMNQIYEVSSCGNKDLSEQPYGMIRTFYIAAEEVEWDYAPNKNWEFEKQHSDGGWERYHRRSRRGVSRVGSHMLRGRLSNVETKNALVLSAQFWQTRDFIQGHERLGKLPSASRERV